MKFHTTRKDLIVPLLQVSSIVERKQTYAILANLLISVRENQLTLTATDLEVELKAQVAVQSDDQGDFTVSAKKITDICKALAEDAELEFRITGEKAILKSGSGRYTLGTLPAVDYPSIEPATVGTVFSVQEKRLKKLIEATQFAMAHQDVRYYLNGLLMEYRDGNLRTVATDGHRLAMSSMAFEQQVHDFQMIIPRKAVVSLFRMLTDSDEMLQIEVSNSHIGILFANGNRFAGKLIDGRYPDYQRVIPEDFAAPLTVDRESLRHALLRTSILSNEKHKGIQLRVSKGTLLLRAHNAEQDEATEELAIDYPGKDITLAFNSNYLLDIINAVTDENVCLHLIDGNSSCVIRGRDGEASTTYVIMPLRL